MATTPHSVTTILVILCLHGDQLGAVPLLDRPSHGHHQKWQQHGVQPCAGAASSDHSELSDQEKTAAFCPSCETFAVRVCEAQLLPVHTGSPRCRMPPYPHLSC